TTLSSYSIPRPFPFSNEPAPSLSTLSSVSNGSLTGENGSSALSSSSALSLSSDVSSVVSVDTKYKRDMQEILSQYKDDPALVRDLLCAYDSLREHSSKKSSGQSMGGFSR
ncbi:hypothetical protein PMAYCL1PPCAC_18000, partial [Pristionchus mayeri]